MITYKNIKRYDDIEFRDYLAMQGLSNSYLKSEVNGIIPGIQVTDNMKIGSMVDAILTDNKRIDFASPYYETGRNIAKKILKEFGDLIPKFDKQVNFTADIELELEWYKYSMPTKGRLDWLIPKQAVIDLKVTKSTNLNELIKFMGYDSQVWHYSRIAQAKAAFLIVHCIKKNTTELIQVDVSGPNKFWESKVEKHGTIYQL
jgi:hypothetical protein